MIAIAPRLAVMLLAATNLLVGCSPGIGSPKNVQATQGEFSDRVEIRWDAVSGAKTYWLSRSLTASGEFVRIGYVDSEVTGTYNSTDSPEGFTITPGVHYFYSVIAVDDGDAESAPSEIAEGWSKEGLPAPTDLAATQGTQPDRIDLTWSGVAGAHQYSIYRAPASGGTFGWIGVVDGQFNGTYLSVTEPPNASIDPGRQYQFQVATRDQDEVDGPRSASVVGWAGQVLPEDLSVQLRWSASSGAPFPGKLMSYTVTVGPGSDGSASFTYWEEDGRTESFDVGGQEFYDLYLLLIERDMFRPTWSENPRPPTGGETTSLLITANGSNYAVPAHPGTGEEREASFAVEQAVADLVPESVWGGPTPP